MAGDLFAGLSDFLGTVVVSSSAPVAALTLRQNASPLSFTTLPVVSRAATRLRFELPQVANGEFTGGSIRTSFIVFNISAATASANLSLSKDDGSPFSVTIPGMGTNSAFNLRLEPGASAFFQTEGSGELAAGAAVIESDQPLGVAAIFTIVGQQGQFLTEAGVGASVALQEFVMPVDSTGQFDTGVALFNGRTVPVALKFRLLNSKGDEDDSVSLRLEENSHMAQFVSDLFPKASNFRGSLSVSASNPVAALTLRQNAQPLSFTTLPVADGVGSPVVTGTWKGSYNLTVNLERLCFNLKSVTHSGELTITISQAEGVLTGTAELTGVREIVPSASSNCVVADPMTVSGDFAGTLSGKSISGEISFGNAGTGQLKLADTAAVGGVETIVVTGRLSDANNSLIGKLEHVKGREELSGAFFLEKLKEGLCDTSDECDGILREALDICGKFKEWVVDFSGETNGYSFTSFLCTDGRVNESCDGILRPIKVDCPPESSFKDCTAPCGGGPVLSSSLALDRQCQGGSEEAQKICNVICTACVPVTLTVKKIGSGSGTVTPDPAGESCGEGCTKYDGGTAVILEALPADDSIFKGWDGDCMGIAPCNLKMTENKTVTATFDKKDQTPPPPFTLTVSPAGEGEGTVTSEAPNQGINCRPDCSKSYPSGTIVTLTAKAKEGSTFESWSGGCSGTGSCTLTMDKDQSVTASFKKSPPPPTFFRLTVMKEGTGSGTVTSEPPNQGINCGPDCSATFENKTDITLTASAADASVFKEWGGACVDAGTNLSCTLTMDSDKSVTATFEPKIEDSSPVGTWEGPYTLTQDIRPCGTVTHKGTLTVVFLESGGNVTGDFTVTGVKNVTPGNCSAPGTHKEMGMNVPVTVTGNRVTSDPIEEIVGLVFDGTIEGTTLKGTLKEPEPVVLNSNGCFELAKKPFQPPPMLAPCTP